ncbi:hypothetical protein T492DRAFT_841497 [Pavlovales sp. CCMP2436]|nr:hypothetical protein T492DRAFT_841497 [Pavlovales sp. CCMP2436]
MLWLSVLMLLPFDLNLIDSTLDAAPQSTHYRSAAAPEPAAPPGGLSDATTLQPTDVDKPAVLEIGLIASVVALAREQLGSPGPARDAAAVVLARILTRTPLQWCSRVSSHAWLVCKDAAAVMLARILTRVKHCCPRMQTHLQAFLGWACKVLADADAAAAADDAAAAAKEHTLDEYICEGGGLAAAEAAVYGAPAASAFMKYIPGSQTPAYQQYE